MGKSKGNSALIGIGAGLLGLAVGAIVGILGSEEKNKEKEKELERLREQQYTQVTKQDTDQAIESLDCAICCEQLKDPMMISRCGHTFDRRCINDWLEKSPRCPLCQTPFQQQDLKQNFVVKELLEEMRGGRKQ